MGRKHAGRDGVIKSKEQEDQKQGMKGRYRKIKEKTRRLGRR